MGQFEKIVVLIVFFLVTVIFVVTFNPSEEQGVVFDMDGGGTPAEELAEAPELSVADRSQGENPWRREEDRGGPLAAEPEGQTPGAGAGGAMTLRELEELDKSQRQAAEQAGQQPDLLLDAGSTPAAETRSLPAGTALITLEGLRDSWDDDIMEYVWTQGDTFVSLAERYYGDRNMARLLRQFNEDVSSKRSGETILVPVFDRRRSGSGASAGTPPANQPVPAATPRPGGTYKVVEGDSLWVIAKKVYGQGSRWEEIYEANKSRLSSPDDVSVDMVLQIP